MYASTLGQNGVFEEAVMAAMPLLGGTLRKAQLVVKSVSIWRWRRQEDNKKAKGQ